MGALLDGFDKIAKQSLELIEKSKPMKCFACSNDLDMYAKCMGCYDKLGAERDQLRELLMIRERKIELQGKEIELLKKLLASFQNAPRSDSDQDKYPVESSWFTDPDISVPAIGFDLCNELFDWSHYETPIIIQDITEPRC